MPWDPFNANLESYSQEELCSLLRDFFRKSEFSLPKERSCNFFDKKDFLVQCLSGMLLFSAIAKKKENEISGYSFIPDDYPVFGKGTPPLSDLMQKEKAAHAAVIHFPTNHAECIGMYVYSCDFPGYSDHKSLLSHTEKIGENYSVFLFNEDTFTPVTQQIDGDSWTLAFQIAKKVIETGCDDRRLIAHQWLVTGECGNEQKDIGRVDVKGKIRLFEKKFRKVILPFDCINECPPNKLYYHVRDFDSCWRIMTGTGFAENQNIALERKVTSLHILVGGSYQPVLSVILLLNPEKICLWVSDITKRNGELIAGALAMENVNVELHKMNSHNLSDAYKDIQEVLEKEEKNANVCVCNTGGNRLMGTAALVAAVDNHRKVIYRDVDSAFNSLTVIDKQTEWESGDVSITPDFKPAEGKQIDWQWLYSKPDGKKIQSADELHDLFIQPAKL